MIAKLSLRSESIVLDIGSGLGGLMCYLVKVGYCLSYQVQLL